MYNQFINIKDGVKFKRLTTPILKLINTIISVWSYHDLSSPTITSANDSKHMKSSLHYKDMAIDIRTKDLSKEQISNVFKSLEDTLGESFQCVLESDHIHLEFDNK